MLLTEATSPGTNIVYTIPIKRTMHANVANKLRLVTGIFFNCGYFFFNFAKSLSNIFIGTFTVEGIDTHDETAVPAACLLQTMVCNLQTVV